MTTPASERQKAAPWLTFASVLMIVAGIMRIFDGIWALRRGGDLPDPAEEFLFGASLSVYGWVWLIVGAALLASAYGVLRGSAVAVGFGVFMATLMAISAAWWLPIYPVWALIYIAIAVAVIYGLVVYGGISITL